MLMNLTRMREVNWKAKMVEYFTTYRYNTTWGDQDLINIFFHFFPEKLLVYPCHWNYRPDHCMYGSTCKLAEEHGASILHGNRGVFHDDKQPSFKAVYNAIDQHKFGTDMEKTIVDTVKADLKTLQTGKWKQCAEVPKQFSMELERQIKLKKAAQQTKNKDTTSDKTNESKKRDEL